MVVQFIQKRGGSWRYRRRVPDELRGRIGKREITIPLGPSEAVALRRYPAVHDKVEKLLRRAALPSSRPPTLTPIDLHRAAHEQIRNLGLDPEWSGAEDPNDTEVIARDVIAEQLAAKYPLDEQGHPLGIAPRDAALLRALMAGTRDNRPPVTLEDAKRQYLSDKVKDNEKHRKQVDRIFELVADVVKLDRPLVHLRRADAREIKDHLLDGRAPASAQRYVNTLKAALTHAARELEVKDFANPFAGLPVENKEKATPSRRKRDAFTADELRAVRDHVMGSPRADLRLIWRLLEGTGCRGAEIAGLRLVDVRLDHPTPHLSVEWHEERRVKTLSSHRLVPLLGDALAAAREAVAAAGEASVLFPAYCREGGPDSLSATLGKYVRACVKRREITPYSLRHRIADLMDLAGVSERDRDLVLGHTKGKTSETYGGEAARLELAKRALEAALATPEKEPR